MKNIKVSLLILLLVMTFVACDSNNVKNTDDDPKATILSEDEKAEILLQEEAAAEAAKVEAEEKRLEEEALAAEAEEKRLEAEKEAELNRIKALTDSYKEHKVNEMGQLIVVMYHNLAEKAGTYATTPDLFRADLMRMYESGYRPVSLSDVVNNTIDIPMGTTPIVLTFDDGYKSDIYYEENGDIGKDSVAGIMLEMAAKYDDFLPRGVIYIYGKNPFRESDLITKKLNDLVEIGFEIGNHTNDHDLLNALSIDEIQAALGKENNFIKTHLPDYDVVHMCYPRGLKPGEDKVEYVFSGEYEGQSYNHISAVNVGWNPIVPYGHLKFNPRSINRVTCGDDDFELQYWLDYFDNKPERRYISDGNPDTIVIPSDVKESVDASILEDVIIYEVEEERE